MGRVFGTIIIIYSTLAPVQTAEPASTANARESLPVSQTELPAGMLKIPAGSFEMGRPYNDEGWAEESPVHTVMLDAFAIGAFPATIDEFAEVMTWAFRQGYLTAADGTPYAEGVIHSRGKALADTTTSSNLTRLDFHDGQFFTRGLEERPELFPSPGSHPVVRVSWYGAVAYANFLSQMEGLPPFYSPEDWTPVQTSGIGYRLPTEAEWERAAAWDVTENKHWRYGFTSDSIDFRSANCWLADYSNPLGLKSYPYTSPVGWYDGVNAARPGGPTTLKSVSPIGAYDMTGNVSEWCYDVFDAHYYASSPPRNPRGPESGKYRILRGGSWSSNFRYCRAACRHGEQPEVRSSYYGFRLCRSIQ